MPSNLPEVVTRAMIPSGLIIKGGKEVEGCLHYDIRLAAAPLRHADQDRLAIG
jgi:hypothetical protein